MFRQRCLFDGFNLPLLVVPSSQSCSSTGCIGDVIESCPTELQVPTGRGKRVGCKGVCDALNSSIYCCGGGTGSSCKAPLYSNFFKNLCPQSYSYAYDDTNASYTCPSTDYQIIFCPGKSINTTSYRPNPIRNTTGGTANNSQPPTREITPSSMPEIRPNATSRRKWEPIVAGVVGGVLAIISFVVIVVLRVRWSKSEDTEEDEEDDHIQQVPGMPVRNVDHSQPESAFHLLRMLQNKAEYILGYLDEYIQSDREEIIRMLEVAAWCLQDDPERRPIMSTVVTVLEGLMEVDSNLVYKFSHALTPPPAVDARISSAPPPASVLSNPR
ncbi:G-TYPE LECTIN S-RECEPTOR-LIKE SERINE/THREONINE-PROTEIN KINASE SD2-5 [Salix viminalis]|uniref:G-TYPE LECTIN S-RECEPTOR-LIKE SERINE/THREONINE-PROTEIN KINASE SD2-5 n=1 Tax=Salix viminalis TaxID=40686 RepID=A0A9Q0U808_SALVM|nr:G-TYPE LECTIN S-RECEPTOR-LIKE SERINE/THREONINE-PROTEIN KINASE SD2-5 [Salix viminalis]